MNVCDVWRLGDGDDAKRPKHKPILDLFAKESRRSVYAGDREVRPPGAPTIGWVPRETDVADALSA